MSEKLENLAKVYFIFRIVTTAITSRALILRFLPISTFVHVYIERYFENNAKLQIIAIQMPANIIHIHMDVSRKLRPYSINFGFFFFYHPRSRHTRIFMNIP